MTTFTRASTSGSSPHRVSPTNARQTGAPPSTHADLVIIRPRTRYLERSTSTAGPGASDFRTWRPLRYRHEGGPMDRTALCLGHLRTIASLLAYGPSPGLATAEFFRRTLPRVVNTTKSRSDWDRVPVRRARRQAPRGRR